MEITLRLFFWQSAGCAAEDMDMPLVRRAFEQACEEVSADRYRLFAHGTAAGFTLTGGIEAGRTAENMADSLLFAGKEGRLELFRFTEARLAQGADTSFPRGALHGGFPLLFPCLGPGKKGVGIGQEDGPDEHEQKHDNG